MSWKCTFNKFIISLLLEKQFVVWYFGPNLTSAGPTKNAEVNHLNWDEVRITATTKHAACVAGAKRGIAGKRSVASLLPPYSLPPDSPPLSIRHLPRQKQSVPISQHSAGGCLSGISNISFGKLQMQPPCEQIHAKTPLWGFNKIVCSVLISHPVDK